MSNGSHAVRCNPEIVSKKLRVLALGVFLMFGPSRANAQSAPQWWPKWTPCDYQGNLLTDGSVRMNGSLTGTGSNTYPSSMTSYALSPDASAPAYLQPYPHGWWITSTYNPNAIFDKWLYDGTSISLSSSFWENEYPGTAAYTYASNTARDTSTAYGGTYNSFYPGGQAINGTSTADVNISLFAYFRWTPYYSYYPGYPMTPPSGSTPPAPPKSLFVLLNTNLFVRTAIDYGAYNQALSPSVFGVIASASARNNLGESCTTTAIDPGGPTINLTGGILTSSFVNNGSGPFAAGGGHLLQAPVYQSGGMYIATAQFSGQTSASATNYVDAQHPAQSEARAGITGEARVDTRSAMIVCPELETGGNYQNIHDYQNATDNRVLNVRYADGSMRVDTVMGPGDLATKSDWGVNLILKAQTTGFDVNTRSSLTGSMTNTSIDWSGESNTGFAEIGPVFGDDSAGNVSTHGSKLQLPATLSAKMKVSDLRPKMQATAENTYTMIIHAPLENAKEVTAFPRVFDNNESYAWSTIVDGNSPTGVQMIVQQPRRWTLLGATPLQVFGNVLSGVCGSGPTILVAPELSAAKVVVADILFNVIGWAVNQTGTPEPASPPKTVVADRPAFDKAISEQQTIYAHGGDMKVLYDIVDCPEDQRFQGSQAFFNTIVSNPSKYWNGGAPRARCHSGIRNIKCTSTGDGYNATGYIGKVQDYRIIPDRHLDNVWQWTVNSLP